MLLKRIYKSAPETGLDHIELRHTGTLVEQNFSRRLVEAAIDEGWMTLSRGKLIVHAKPEDLIYTICRSPGYYCLHCGGPSFSTGGVKIESDALGAGARAHVAEKHAGVKSPDPQWPAGYMVTHSYECVLDLAQHEKFKALPIGRKPKEA